MIRLIGLAISIGIADSLNPTTIAPGLYLAAQEHPRRKLAQFTAGVFGVYFLAGAIIALGPGRLLISLLPHPHRHTRALIEVSVGALLLLMGTYLFARRAKLAAKALPAVDAKGKSSALLGATITAIELPTAFPYFAVIAAIIGSDVGPARALFLLLLFNVLFIAPLLAIVGVLSVAPHSARRTLGAARAWLQRRWPQSLGSLLVVAGVIIVLLGVTGLTSPHSRFNRLLRKTPLPQGLVLLSPL